jgi:PGF-CTERM protein
VVRSGYDDPGVTVSDWKTVRANITEHSGEGVRLAMYADGRRTFESEETTAWVEVDYIQIRETSQEEQDKEFADGRTERTRSVISRINDGKLYQTGEVTEVAGTVEAGGNISMTGEIQAEAPEASDDIVYSSVGLSDGTVLDVEQMDGLGSGNVTHSLNIPERPDGDVVWSFHSAVTEEKAIERFKSDAQDDFVDDQGRNLGIVIVEGEEYVRRISDGELYQTGEVTEVVGTVEAGSNISVTAEIKAEAPEASDDIVYGSVGLSDGTVLDVERMDGSGNGTVTHILRIPETADGELVWSFHSTTTEGEAIDIFEVDAQDGFVDDQGRDLGIFVGTVSDEDEERVPGFTVVAALLALASVAAVLLRRRE